MALARREPHRMAQHDRASRAEKGWRVPRDGRTSGMSEKTSRSGRGCGLMRGGLHARVLGHGGVPGKRGPTGNTTLALVLGLLCNLFPKTEWPCEGLGNLDIRPPGPIGICLEQDLSTTKLLRRSLERLDDPLTDSPLFLRQPNNVFLVHGKPP